MRHNKLIIFQRIDNPSSPAELNADAVVQYVLKVDDSPYQDDTTKVVLGSDMKLEFTSLAWLTQFYVYQCVASNELPENDANYVSLALVESGCPVNTNDDPEKSINPQLIDNRQTLTFSQFGFVGQQQQGTHFQRLHDIISSLFTDDPELGDIELKFALSCTLKFGSAPNCLANRRNDETTETTDIMLGECGEQITTCHP